MGNRPGHRAHNKLPVELHWARGTWRADRHALPSAVSGAKAAPWTPDPGELDRLGLGAAGKELVNRFHRVFEFGLLDFELIAQAAILADRLSEVRAQRLNYPVEDLGLLDRRELGFMRLYITVMQSLRARVAG